MSLSYFKGSSKPFNSLKPFGKTRSKFYFYNIIKISKIMSPNSHLQVGEHQYLNRASEALLKPTIHAYTAVTCTISPSCAPPPLLPTGIMPAVNALIAEAYTTHPLSVQSSSLKRVTIYHASRNLLS